MYILQQNRRNYRTSFMGMRMCQTIVKSNDFMARSTRYTYMYNIKQKIIHIRNRSRSEK